MVYLQAKEEVSVAADWLRVLKNSTNGSLLQTWDT